LNQEQKIVIIGCGAGGGTAAQFAKKQHRKSKILILEKGKYPQYSKCGLPYVLSGVIPKLSDLFEFSEEWFKKAGITLSTNTLVDKIDVNKKKVIAKKDDEIIEESYDLLIISTGSKPFIPPIKNIFLKDKLIDGVFSIRTIDDIKKIQNSVKKGKRAVVIGAGFIGLEIADNLNKIGINVKVVEALPQILLTTFDEDMSKIIYNKISEKIDIILNSTVTKIETKNGKINQLLIKNNKTNIEQKIITDFLILAVGCRPEVSLAKNIGCKIGKTGGIIVNEKCETNIKNIYAVGDCTEFLDFVTKRPVQIGLGSIAVRQAITAGINASGGNYLMPKGVLQTRTSKFFGLEIAGVGPTMDFLISDKIVTATFKGFSLPPYFPGGKPISLKVIADKKSGKIISAQAVGNNAAQRINSFATAILAEMTIEDFKKLETAYSPAVAPTIDIVTIVCDIISKKLKIK